MVRTTKFHNHIFWVAVCILCLQSIKHVASLHVNEPQKLRKFRIPIRHLPHGIEDYGQDETSHHTNRRKRNVGNPEIAINQIEGTYKTNCRVDGYIYKWNGFIRKILPYSSLNGKEVIHMTLWRFNGIQTRYFEGDFEPEGKIIESKEFGLFRTVDGERFLIIPKIQKFPNCTAVRVNKTIEARFMANSGNARVYHMFYEFDGNFSYVSIDSQIFRKEPGQPDTIGFRTFRLMRNFFSRQQEKNLRDGEENIETFRTVKNIINNQIKDPEIKPKHETDNSRVRRAKNEDYELHKISRRAVPTPGGPPPTIGVEPTVPTSTIAGQCGQAGWRITQKVDPPAFYDRIYDSSNKIFEYCNEIIGPLSCNDLERRWPNWIYCNFDVKFCGNTGGNHGAASLEDSAVADIIIERINRKRQWCSDVRQNKGVYDLYNALKWKDADIDQRIYKLSKGVYDFSVLATRQLEQVRNDSLNAVNALNTANAERHLVNDALKQLKNATGAFGRDLKNLAGIVKKTETLLSQFRVAELPDLIKIVDYIQSYLHKIGEHNGLPFEAHHTQTKKDVFGELANETQKSIDSINSNLKKVQEIADVKISSLNLTLSQSAEDLKKMDDLTQNLKNQTDDNKKAAVKSAEDSSKARELAANATKKGDETVEVVDKIGAVQRTQESGSLLDIGASGNLGGFAAGGLITGSMGLGISTIALLLSCIGLCK